MIGSVIKGDAVSEVLCLRAAWADVEGIHEIAWGPMAKVFVKEAVRKASPVLLG